MDIKAKFWNKLEALLLKSMLAVWLPGSKLGTVGQPCSRAMAPGKLKEMHRMSLKSNRFRSIACHAQVMVLLDNIVGLDGQ